MKTLKTFIFSCQLVALSWLLGGCANPLLTPRATPSTAMNIESPEEEIVGNSQYATETRTSFPTSTIGKSGWPISPDAFARMIISLQDKDCVLPCYLGITPGKTSVNDAQAILQSIGGTLSATYIRKSDHAISYSYDLNIGKYTLKNGTEENDENKVIIFNHVSLITNNDIIQIIDASIGTIQSQEAMLYFRKYWESYTVEKIFTTLGQPDGLYLDYEEPELEYYGRTLLVEYQNIGVEINYYGTENEINICPSSGFEAKYIYLQLSIFNPKAKISIYSDGRALPARRDIWLPIEEVLGITPHEFYRRVRMDPTACFSWTVS